MTQTWLARNVERSPDLDRICALPRRTADAAYMAQWVEEVTEAFITPLGRREGASLRPAQATAIVEIVDNRGAYLGYSVGTGKELTIMLSALALGAQRPVLGVPAGLARQTRDDWARYSRHWKTPNPVPRIITYEEMTDEPKVDLLDRISPDLVLLNEADVLRNASASMVKRLDRFRIAHWDDCDFVAFTGTPGRLSILDLWHILIWCLRERAPVPLDRGEAETWAAAIDEKGSRFGVRPGVGALRQLGGEGATLVDQARDGFRRRLTETPGVVILSGDSCDQPLHIRQILAPHDPVLEQHFARFRGPERCTPSGDRVGDPLSIYRYAGELGAGFYSYFDPKPPEEWLDARRNKNAFVEEVIEASASTDRPLDTEAAVMRAYPRAWQVIAWRSVKDIYDPAKHTKQAWLSDSVVEFVLDYMDQADAAGTPTLVWCWQVPFCEALEYASRERALAGKGPARVWYAQKGLARDGRYIGKSDATRSCILSGGANLRGRNLQAFQRNLLVTPPQSARYLEQCLGRTHRQGQDSAVHVDWLVTSYETALGLEKAVSEARFGKATWGVSQKLIHCGVDRVSARTWPRETFRFAVQPRAVPQIGAVAAE